LLFAGCPNAAGGTGGLLLNGGGGGGGGGTTAAPALDTELRFNQNDPLRYFSLTTGEEVPAGRKDTADWDIAVEYDGFIQIYTNSGDSGPGSGGVTFTGKTDFADVALADGVTEFTGEYAEYAPYTEDVTRWVGSMGSASQTIMNVMTYLGYISGSGTQESPFSPSPFAVGDSSKKMYAFNKKQCYDHRGGTMAPLYDPTLQVYVVTHADGIAKSKFQLSGVAVTYIAGALPKLYADMKFKYEAFE
jgi:hypothetical protein